MTPMEQFIANSERLRTEMLNEALQENAKLRQLIADAAAEQQALLRLLNEAGTKIVELQKTVVQMQHDYNCLVDSSELETRLNMPH